MTLGLAPLAQVTLAAGGRSGQTDAAGTYEIADLDAGAYEVVPARRGYAFTPRSRPVTLTGDEEGVDFGAEPAFDIRGRVIFNGGGLAGARVQAGSWTATSGEDGSYLLADLPAGRYALAASKEGYYLTPVWSGDGTVTVGPSQEGRDFTAVLDSFRICGRITAGPPRCARYRPVAGASVTACGRTMVTGKDGTYCLADLRAGSCVVTPAKKGCTFSPTTRTVRLPPDAETADFTATCPPELLTLTLRPLPRGVPAARSGRNVTGTIMLSGPVRSPTPVALQSSHPALAPVPAQATIPRRRAGALGAAAASPSAPGA